VCSVLGKIEPWGNHFIGKRFFPKGCLPPDNLMMNPGHTESAFWLVSRSRVFGEAQESVYVCFGLFMYVRRVNILFFF